MQGTERVEVTSAALLSFLQAEQEAAEWETLPLERHDPGKHNQKDHGDWAHPKGQSSSSSSSHASSSSPAQHMSATLASKAAFYQGLASHPVSKTWTAQDQQLAAQMAKDFQAIADGLKSGKDVTSLVADMTKAAQSLHDAAPTHMTQARLDVMTGMQKRISHALSQHAASSSSSSSGSSSHGSTSGHAGSSSSGASSSGHSSTAHHGTSSSGHSGSSGSSSKGHTSSSSSHHAGSSGHSSASSSHHSAGSSHHSASSTSGSSHHSGSSGASGSGHSSSGSSSHHSGASSSHGGSHSSHGASSGHSSSGRGSSSSSGGSSSGHSSGGSKGSGGSSSGGSGSSQSSGSSSGGSSTASPQAQHMSSVLADKASFYSDLASKAVGKTWTQQDQQIASQLAQDMQSISDGLKSGKDVSAQIADMVKSAQALHDASPSHMTETKLDVMAGLQKRIGNALKRALSADEAFERRDYSQSERDQMDDSDFAGPHESYPIKTQQDVYNAARLIGHADNPDAVKARIKAIAKRKGFNLPDSWQQEEDSSKERAMGKGNHAPFTGTHTHAHPAFGSQGDDEMHSHEHTHDNDADHGHSHDDESAGDTAERSVQAMTSQDFSLYLPITRTDATQRRVFGQATIEQPDAYGTIFGFYPEAWKTWRGNIREQHDPKKAVGKALEVLPDEQRRAIDVDLKVSRGAQDTWLKVEDGVLTGLSASIIPDEEFGNDIRKWPKKEYGGKQYPYLPRYSVVELSLVDNPATPGCNIQIVRSQGGASLATDVLDNTDEATITPETPTADAKERAGARLSADSRSALHDMRDKALQLCGCDQCQAMAEEASESPDEEASEEAMAERMQRVLERSLAPVYSRQQQFLARLAQYDTRYETIQTYLADLQSHMGLLSERLANSNSPVLERVLADLSAVKVEVEKIAAQPMPGGPILNGARPAEKTLATDPYRAPRDNAQEVLARMQQLGALDTIDKQVAAAALAALPVRGPYSR